MKTFTNQIKGYNKKFAAGYIVYMMGGSYFHKCECKNKHEEKHLFLHYAEMPSQKQIEMEDKILKIIERMDKEFLAQLAKMKCEVHFFQCESEYHIEFHTGGFEKLRFRIKENGEVSAY